MKTHELLTFAFSVPMLIAIVRAIMAFDFEGKKVPVKVRVRSQRRDNKRY